MKGKSRFTMEMGRIVVLREWVTDGDESKWPETTEPKVTEDGMVNYLEVAHGVLLKHWKQELARFLIQESGKVKYDPSIPYILKDFPAGYRLFNHKKGPKNTPRTDAYLYGSKYGMKFRSPAEFFYHIRWIDRGMPVDEDGCRDCGCIYCDENAKQSEISKKWLGRKPIRIHKKEKKEPEDDDSDEEKSPTQFSPPLMYSAKDYTILGSNPSALTNGRELISGVVREPPKYSSGGSSTLVVKTHSGIGGGAWKASDH